MEYLKEGKGSIKK